MWTERMRIVIQRVRRAAVRVNDEVIGAIGRGFLALVAFQAADDESVLRTMAEKLVNLRLFEDEQEKMNLSLLDVQGEALIVSQFTLYGDARRGRRPSFTASAPAEQAEKLYRRFLAIAAETGVSVASGQFQAHMEVELINDGPVTLLLDSDKLF